MDYTDNFLSLKPEADRLLSIWADALDVLRQDDDLTAEDERAAYELLAAFLRGAP